MLALVRRRGLRGLDAVAGSASGRLFDALSDSGELAVDGLLSSDRVELPAAELLCRDLRVWGYSRLRCYSAMTPERRVAIGAERVGLLADGESFSPTEAGYHRADVRRAVAHHEQPGRGGKMLLVSPSP